MASDSDSSNGVPVESDSDFETGDDDGDLSQLGAAATTVKFQTVKKKSYQMPDGGTDKLAQQILGCNEPIDGALVPAVGLLGVDESHNRQVGCDARARVIQQNIIQVQQQFGDVTVQGTRNLTIGGTQNIGMTAPPQTEKENLTRPEKIRRRTSSRIATWTKGMVKTSALGKVMEKLGKGTTWVTIKGSPGEGKSTVAYMALEKLQASGRQVFQVLSPKEFSEVTTSCSRPVIMLDDIFGDLEFDQTEWLKWKPVLHEILDEKEHRLHEEEEIDLERNDATVILVGRNYVLKSASPDMGRLSEFFQNHLNVVDMSHSVERGLEEKLDIWEAVVEPRIKLTKEKIIQICKIKGQHGFPHVCRLFVAMHQEEANTFGKSFFQTPLEFLNQTMEKFMQDERKLALFKEMLKRNGEVSLRDLGELENSAQIIKVANDLQSTYLRKDDDYFMFDHPSVYDSVAYNLCNFYPFFVIQNCNMSFLHERIRLANLTKEVNKVDKPCSSESGLVAYIPRSYIGDLAKRFADEVTKRNILQVLSHRACADELFIEHFMSNVDSPLTELLNMTDVHSGQSFLELSVSSKSPQLLKYVNDRMDILKNKKIVDIILLSTYKHAASEVLMYLTQTCDNIDINIQYGDERMTPLMIAAETKDSEFVNHILCAIPDQNVCDTLNRLALHYLCENGIVSAAEQVLDMWNFIDVVDVRGCCPLYYACKRNQTSVMRMLLDRGARLDAESVRVACTQGNTDAVDLLFARGATVNMVSLYGASPLHSASEGGNVEMVTYLIEKGASVNKPGRADRSPLHTACMNHWPDVIQCLLEHGAAIESRDTDGQTPLHKASWLSSTQCVELLLKSGANVNVRDNAGYTPLLNMMICRDYEKCANVLLKAGAEVNAHDKDGKTPLFEAIEWGSQEYFDMLLKAGADVNLQTLDGYTPLHLAAKFGRNNRLAALLKFDSDVNAQSKDGSTPLHMAAEKGSAICLSLLLLKVHVTNSQRKDGCTPLHVAVNMGNIKCIDVLLQRGADVNKQTNIGFTALHVATQIGNTKCVCMLLKHGANVNAQSQDDLLAPLHIAAQKGFKSCANALLKYGADMNLQSKDGFTPLHQAVKKGFTGFVSFLLRSLVNVNEQSNDGSTPLHLAIESGLSESVQCLLKGRADITVQRDDGCTPLHVAAELGYSESLHLLLTSGADANSRDKKDQTPLHKAANLSGYVFYGHHGSDVSIYRALIKCGGDVNAPDKSGDTALHLLCREESMNEMYEDSAAEAYGRVYRDIVRLLVQEGACVSLKNKAGEPALCESCLQLVADILSSQTLKTKAEVVGSSHAQVSDEQRRSQNRLKKTCRTH